MSSVFDENTLNRADFKAISNSSVFHQPAIVAIKTSKPVNEKNNDTP